MHPQPPRTSALTENRHRPEPLPHDAAPTVEELDPANTRTIDVLAASRVLAFAFGFQPVAKWLVPDDSTRLGVLTDYFQIVVEHAVEFGHVLRSVDVPRFLVWFHDHDTPIPPNDYPRRLRAACGEHTPRFIHLATRLREYRPTDAPYVDLAYLGVTPDAQEFEFGSALLTRLHNDVPDLPVYAEALSTQGRDFLTGHGYQADEPIMIADGVHVWPMRRNPVPSTG